MNVKIILLAIVTVFTAAAFGQNSAVKRGPRQEVTIDLLPENAFYPSLVNIKFKAGFDTLLQTSLSKLTNRNFRFGITAVDDILRNLGITGAARSFERILGSTENDSKHRAWGFQRWYTIKLPKQANVKDAIRKFKALSNIIETAEPSYKRTLYDGSDPVLLWTPSDSAYNKQWHFNHTAQDGPTSPPGTDADIDLPEAWDLEKGKPNVIVAIMDGGVDTSHPDLRQNLWIGLNGERFGYNWYDNSNLLQTSSHATHVAGTIGAVNNNGIGVSGIAGGDGSPGSGVRIMNMQVFSSSGSYAGDEAVANAFVYSADHGAAISQNSWGGGAFSMLVTDAIDYFIMNGGGKVLNGGLVFFSAGNDDSEQENFPGSYPPVVCVAASNYDDKKSSYSSYGSWVDISAPGGETNTSIRKGILSTLPVAGGSYGWLSGTSMACPHVSGVAALCASKVPGRLSNDQLRNILLSTTDDIYPFNPDFINKLGTGRVNAFKAVQAAAQASGILIDSVKSFSVTQSCGEATLKWTKDKAGDQVIIAAADTLLFGTPSGSLQVGDKLPGGGTIIYKGPGVLSTNLLTTNQRRYFRIWSFSGTNYSLHKTNTALFSRFVGPLTVKNAAGCNISLAWADSLSCITDSVILTAGNNPITSLPSGVLFVGDTVMGGSVVIYKGRDIRYVYSTAFDSTVFVQKWNFNSSHTYVNPFADSPDSVSKANAILSVKTASVTDHSIAINWQPSASGQCFGGNTYLLAYSTNEIFGNPTGIYHAGDAISGGGTILYIGNNTNFQHTNLTQNSPYCYKVWKVKSQSEYSYGKSSCSRTLCNNSTIVLPFADGFEGGDLSDPDICHWQLTDSTSGTNALKIVTNGNHPTVSPVQGSAMISFNSFNIQAGETVRLSSAIVKKGVNKDVDLLFRWYQDSSIYVNSDYDGEGVMVQWSTDKLNWQNLEFYPRVPKAGMAGWSYKQITLPPAASAVDSLFVSFLFTSGFGNNCFLDDLKIKYSSFKPSDGLTKIAACESTDSTTKWTNYYDSTGDRLLSIKKNNQDIGRAGQNGFIIAVGGTSEAVTIPSNSNYAGNPGGWITMNRFYSFKPLIEPAQNINARFYYFTADFTAISNAANSQLSPVRPNLAQNDLYAWKINDVNNAYNANPALGHIGIPPGNIYGANGYNQYINAALPDTTIWRYTNLGNNLHSMEYLVRHSGGGGLGVGSANGRGALQIITYTFTGSGNWSTIANWAGGNKPPAVLPSNGRIIINPAGTGECVLDVQQTIPAGAELIVNPLKKFRITSSLQVKN